MSAGEPAGPARPGPAVLYFRFWLSHERANGSPGVLGNKNALAGPGVPVKSARAYPAG
jgi:hypothetical protein